MITVDDIGIIAKEPKALKEDAFGTPTRWLRGARRHARCAPRGRGRDAARGRRELLRQRS